MLKQKGFQGERLQLAYSLLAEESTTPEKVVKIASLLKGLDPSLDRALERFSLSFSKLGKLENGELISLSAELLPERNEKEKKRKKAILLFFTHWKSLRSEVERVQNILSEEGSDGNSREEKFTKAGKIMGLAKGPLGLVTVVAVIVAGALLYLNAASVKVEIRNIGCQPFNPSEKATVKLPGLKLPTDPIESGDSGSATVPPFKFDLNSTTPGRMTLKILSYDFSFSLGSVRSVKLDGKELVGESEKIDLGSAKYHKVDISCN